LITSPGLARSTAFWMVCSGDWILFPSLLSLPSGATKSVGTKAGLRGRVGLKKMGVGVGVGVVITNVGVGEISETIRT